MKSFLLFFRVPTAHPSHLCGGHWIAEEAHAATPIDNPCIQASLRDAGMRDAASGHLEPLVHGTIRDHYHSCELFRDIGSASQVQYISRLFISNWSTPGEHDIWRSLPQGPTRQIQSLSDAVQVKRERPFHSWSSIFGPTLHHRPRAADGVLGGDGGSLHVECAYHWLFIILPLGRRPDL